MGAGESKSQVVRPSCLCGKHLPAEPSLQPPDSISQTLSCLQEDTNQHHAAHLRVSHFKVKISAGAYRLSEKACLLSEFSLRKSNLFLFFLSFSSVDSGLNPKHACPDTFGLSHLFLNNSLSYSKFFSIFTSKVFTHYRNYFIYMVFSR